MKLIDRDALKVAVDNGWQPDMMVSEIWDIIDEQPTVDAEPVRHGQWLLPEVCYEDIECSACHAYMPLPISFDYRPTYKYCPMCGAKMDEVSK